MVKITDAKLWTQAKSSLFAYSISNLGDMPQYLGDGFMDTVSQDLGAVNPIINRDPQRVGAYVFEGFTNDPPALGETTINQRMQVDAAAYLETLANQNCVTHLLTKIGDCGDPDELETWDSILSVVAVKMTNIEFSSVGSFDTEDVVELSGTFSYLNAERIFPLLFTEKADTTIVAEVIKIFYSDSVSCGECGDPSNGYEKVYALTVANAGSPGLSSQVVYTTDAFSSVTSVDIPELGGVSASDMTVAGPYLVVVSENTGSHVYVKKDDITAAGWVEVTSGYTGGAPRAVYAQSAKNVLMAAAGGYIYRSTDITASVTIVNDNSLTTENLNDIDGELSTVIAVGDNNVVLKSNNAGKSYSLVTGPEVGVNLVSVSVVSKNKYFIGTASGKLWYTQDGGTTWTQRALPNQANIAVVWDITFDPFTLDQIGALGLELSDGSGDVYRTITGGREWYRSNTNALSGLPTIDPDRIRSVAVGGYNRIVAGGLQGSDGIILLAQKD